MVKGKKVARFGGFLNVLLMVNEIKSKLNEREIFAKVSVKFKKH